MTDHEGQPAKVKFTSRLDYVPFRLKDDAAGGAAGRRGRARRIGREPNLRVTNGGLDANWMVKHGIPTVTFGAGQNEIHTVKEWVDLTEFETRWSWPTFWPRRRDLKAVRCRWSSVNCSDPCRTCAGRSTNDS